jgi:hypothetical protein
MDALNELKNYEFDIEAFRLRDRVKESDGTFVYRIPWEWCKAALRLPGSATQVGLVIWYYYGLRHKSEVTLSRKKLEDYGISRSSAMRGLNYLEKEGLVKTQRSKNSSPRVVPISPIKKVTS